MAFSLEIDSDTAGDGQITIRFPYYLGVDHKGILIKFFFKSGFGI